MNTLVGVLKSSKSWSISNLRSDHIHYQDNRKSSYFRANCQNDTQSFGEPYAKNIFIRADVLLNPTRNHSRVIEIEKKQNLSNKMLQKVSKANESNYFELSKTGIDSVSLKKPILHPIYFNSLNRQVSHKENRQENLKRPISSNPNINSTKHYFFTSPNNQIKHLNQVNKGFLNISNKPGRSFYIPIYNNQVTRASSFFSGNNKTNPNYPNKTSRIGSRQDLFSASLNEKRKGSISPRSHIKDFKDNLNSIRNENLSFKILNNQENTLGIHNNQVTKPFIMTPNKVRSSILNIGNSIRENYYRSNQLVKPLLNFPNLEPNESEIDLRDIKIKSLLGFGSTSLVYLAIWRGTEVAIKIFGSHKNKELENNHSKFSFRMFVEPLKTNQGDSQRYLDFKYEINMMRLVRHPNIVQYMGGNIKSNPPFLVSEFCSGGTLFNLLHGGVSKKCPKSKDFSFSGPSINLSVYQRLKILLDVARGIHFLHSSNPAIIHRDIKSLNIFLIAPIKRELDIPLAKIGDFGLSQQRISSKGSYNKAENLVGTYQWMAPEVIKNQVYNEYIDIYSFGMTMYEVLSNKTPFFEMGVDVNPDFLVAEIIRGTRPALKYILCDIPKEVINIMVRCWDPIPSNRGSMLLIIEELEVYLNKYKTN